MCLNAAKKQSIALLLVLTVAIVEVCVDVSVEAATIGQAAESSQIQAVAIANQHSPKEHIISGGQPTQQQLAALKAAGVKHVINLRTAGEQGWDEAGYVQSLGMQYHAIPIAGAAGITDANAKALATLLNKLAGEATLVHCASGNRVGALIALSAAERGQTVDEAITEGKRWGLTRLESAVRKQIAREQIARKQASEPVELCCARQEATNSGS